MRSPDLSIINNLYFPEGCSQAIFISLIHFIYKGILRNLYIKLTPPVSTLFSSFLIFSLMFIIEIMTTAFIIGILILMKPLPTLLTGSTLVITIFVFWVFRKKMGELGKTRQLHGEQMIQWVNQGLGGIKDVKILGKEKFLLENMEKTVCYMWLLNGIFM